MQPLNRPGSCNQLTLQRGTSTVTNQTRYLGTFEQAFQDSKNLGSLKTAAQPCLRTDGSAACSSLEKPSWEYCQPLQPCSPCPCLDDLPRRQTQGLAQLANDKSGAPRVLELHRHIPAESISVRALLRLVAILCFTPNHPTRRVTVSRTASYSLRFCVNVFPSKLMPACTVPKSVAWVNQQEKRAQEMPNYPRAKV
jgi:hypothetical protein